MAVPHEPALTEAARAAEHDLGTPFDLTVCAREPIHRLGTIQSYGCLVAARDGVIETVSANTGTLLGVAPTDLIGRPVALLLDTADPDRQPSPGRIVVLRPRTGSRRFAVTMHVSDGLDVLEFEPMTAEPTALSVAAVSRTLHRLQDSGTVTDACDKAVHEIQALTGYDRVVVYRFAAPDGPGEVIAEAATAGHDPWLGLWFPAVDIPPQARELYRRNWIRVIADVDDPAAPLLPPVLPATGSPLDLSWSVLRHVSGYHLEYLRNIAVRSSMSVSLLDGEHLWGLIACHGDRPRTLSPDQRSACELFGTALSLHLDALRQRDEQAGLQQARARLSRTISDLADQPFPPADLAPLARLIEADSVIVHRATVTRHVGAHPGEAAVAALRQVVPALEPGQVWCHGNVAALGAGLGAWHTTLSGALVLCLGPGDDSITWIRGEQQLDQRWAVDPDRPVRSGAHGQRLTPRGSSAVHARTVRGHSRPWTEADTTIAGDLGRLLDRVVIAHAAELAAVNDRLARSNRDLQFFTHTVAHDLREPLRGMRRAVADLAAGTPGTLPAEIHRARVATLQRLTGRMTGLLDTLLNYALAGHHSLDHQTIDLRELADRAAEVAGPRLRERGVSLHLPVPGRYPVRVDPTLFEEILTNLLVNAAKYARDDEPDRWVSIGMAPVVPPGDRTEVDAVHVRDNGIGIPAELRRTAFDLFTRHPRAGRDDDGAGAGLAIVRRLVEAHDGRIWLHDEPGAATSVQIALPEPDSGPGGEQCRHSPNAGTAVRNAGTAVRQVPAVSRGSGTG